MKKETKKRIDDFVFNSMIVIWYVAFITVIITMVVL